MFRDNISVSSSRVKNPIINPRLLGPIGCPETSVRKFFTLEDETDRLFPNVGKNYHYTLRINQEEGSSLLDVLRSRRCVYVESRVYIRNAFPGCYPVMQRSRYIELYFCLLFCMGVKLGR